MSRIRRRPIRRPTRPGMGMFRQKLRESAGAVLGGRRPRPGNVGRPRPGNVGGPRPAVYRPPSGVRKKTTSMMGAMGSGGNPFGGQMFAEGGEAKKYPNKGLEALAKEAPEVVERMGYKNGGMVASCPHRGEIQGVGNVDVVDGKPRGTKFVGTR